MARPFLTANDQADVFRAVAHRWRRVVLELLSDEPAAVGDLLKQVPINPATLSGHLRILREAGLVKVKRQGHALIYQANLGRLAAIRRWLDTADAPRSRKKAS